MGRRGGIHRHCAKTPSHPSHSTLSSPPVFCSATREEEPYPKLCLSTERRLFCTLGISSNQGTNPMPSPARCRGQTPALHPRVLSSPIRHCHEQDTHMAVGPDWPPSSTTSHGEQWQPQWWRGKPCSHSWLHPKPWEAAAAAVTVLIPARRPVCGSWLD